MPLSKQEKKSQKADKAYIAFMLLLELSVLSLSTLLFAANTVVFNFAYIIQLCEQC